MDASSIKWSIRTSLADVLFGGAPKDGDFYQLHASFSEDRFARFDLRCDGTVNDGAGDGSDITLCLMLMQNLELRERYRCPIGHKTRMGTIISSDVAHRAIDSVAKIILEEVYKQTNEAKK